LCFRITAFRQLPLTLPLLQLRPTGQAGWIWDCKCTSLSLFRKDFLIPDLKFLIEHLFILFAPWSPSPAAQLSRSRSSPTPPSLTRSAPSGTPTTTPRNWIRQHVPVVLIISTTSIDF
jgi:hypothetical protein